MRSLLKPAVLFVVLLAFFALTLSSCEREPSSGPNREGINGNVKIFNQFGEKQDPSGVTVTIVQTGKTTRTDSEGAYVLLYLESGNYTLVFTKAGQPTTYLRDIAHVRTKHTSTPAPVTRMIEPSSYFVTQAAVVVNKDPQNNPFFTVTGKLNKAVPAGKEVKIKLYLGKEEAVTLSNYIHTISYKVTNQEFQVNYPYIASLLQSNEMQRGDRVYMVMYTDAVEEADCDGPWNKPDCSNSTTINISNALIFSEFIP